MTQPPTAPQSRPRDAVTQALGNMIAAIGEPWFYEALLAYIGAVVPNDSALVVVCDHDKAPAVRCDQLLPSQRSRLYETWMSGVFQLGPYYNMHRQDRPDGLYMLREIAPDNFRASEYFRVYYRQIGQSDMAGYLIRTGEERHVIVYLSRMAGNPRFSLAERRQLMNIAEISIQSTLKHWQIRQDRLVEAGQGRNRALLASFGRSVLSDREYEIVHMLLQGHSAKQIAHDFDITDHTVRAHLKHAYKKLKVRSQAELFSLLLRHLGV